MNAFLIFSMCFLLKGEPNTAYIKPDSDEMYIIEDETTVRGNRGK
jgi:hypothetical protein